MATLLPRTIEALAAEPVPDDPWERVLLAFRLWDETFPIFLAGLPPGTTADEAIRIHHRMRQWGRTPSKCMGP